MKMLRKKRQKGFTLIELLIVIAVIAILAAIAIPNLLSSKKGANESNAISTLKSLVNAQETFKSRNLGGNNEYGDLDALVTAKVITFAKTGTTSGTYVNSGYVFSPLVNTATQFAVKAEPESPASGDRSFGVTEDGFVREEAAQTLSASDVAGIQALPVVGG